MKLGVGFFLKYFISIGFTIFAFVNILYTFNLVAVIGGAWVGSGYPIEDDYSDKYFGVSTFITAFETYFNQNVWLDAGKELQQWMSWFTDNGLGGNLHKVLFKYFGDNNATQTISIITSILILPWDIVSLFGYLVYGIGMVVYILGIGFQFVFFFIFLLSGACWTQLPDTYHLYMIPHADILTSLNFLLI